MIGEEKTEALLDKIADKAGVAFLSDLRRIRSANFLFSIFADIDTEYYNLDDWKNAISYIFDLNGHFVNPRACNEIILWNTGQWGQHIAEILENHFTRRHTIGSFYHVTGKYGPRLSPQKKYLVFYHPSSTIREELKDFNKKNHPNMFYAAICSDYNDGLISMENGDNYALKLPLEREKVIRCYELYISESSKKEELA